MKDIDKVNIKFKECLKCRDVKNIEKNFYMSNSQSHSDQKYPICKKCIKERLNVTADTDFLSDHFLDKFHNVLLEMNKPFIYSLFLSSLEESKGKDSDDKKKGREFFGVYLKNVFLNCRNLSWKDSEFSDIKTEIVSISSQKEETSSGGVLIVNKNKEDVIRMLGYDPFETESDSDRKYLYDRLVDFLDESTLEDSFKLPAVIEIVKSFNQIDKINRALSMITADTITLSKNVGSVKALIDSKEKILKTMLALAKDNGISVNHNNNKSKGGGTLSGIMKQLQEKGFEEAEVNLFDIETAKGIRQVADISNESIRNQLQFDENDYSSMIIDQRELIQELESRLLILEEENRKLKKNTLKIDKE